jgi:methionyl-tRNA formyltransferase
MNVDLCIPPDHALSSAAVRLVEAKFKTRVVPADKAALLDEKPGDMVLNFLGSTIFRGRVLDVSNVNFHPAPPEYPGRGGASRALFDGSATFGATAHRMERTPDSGPIYAVERFPIEPAEGCASVFARAEAACLDLLGGIVSHLAEHQTLPPPTDAKWVGRAMTRKQFEAWLVLDPADPESFERKIAAARHPRFPGPYVIVNGHRFGLAD